MKEELRTIKDKELDSLFQRILPPEEFGEDSNVEELYNRIIDIESKLEAKDKECASKIAAGERLRMEDAMSAINEANGLREKIKEQELIIYGIEEGAEQWESLCADKDNQIADLKAKLEEAENLLKLLAK